MNIVLLGPPGAGKGTQGQRLAAALAIPHISSGAIFRAFLAGGTPLALQVQGYLDRGEYVPDALTDQVVLPRLDKPDARRGFILDGYPRTVSQATSLDRALAEEGRAINVALDIDAPDDVITQRMLLRHATEGRADDVPEVIRHRIRVFREETLPVVDYYRRTGRLTVVDGSGPVPEVNALVDGALGLAAPQGSTVE